MFFSLLYLCEYLYICLYTSFVPYLHRNSSFCDTTEKRFKTTGVSIPFSFKINCMKILDTYNFVSIYQSNFPIFGITQNNLKNASPLGKLQKF